MKEILEAHGVDWDRTMGRFLYDEALYAECLDMLCADPGIDRIRAALAGGDFRAAFEAAHTLKGVSANMGISPLYRCACEIVEPLRACEVADYPPMLNALDAAFQDTLRMRDELKRRPGGNTP